MRRPDRAPTYGPALRDPSPPGPSLSRERRNIPLGRAASFCLRFLLDLGHDMAYRFVNLADIDHCRWFARRKCNELLNYPELIADFFGYRVVSRLRGDVLDLRMNEIHQRRLSQNFG